MELWSCGVSGPKLSESWRVRTPKWKSAAARGGRGTFSAAEMALRIFSMSSTDLDVGGSVTTSLPTFPSLPPQWSSEAPSATVRGGLELGDSVTISISHRHIDEIE